MNVVQNVTPAYWGVSSYPTTQSENEAIAEREYVTVAELKAFLQAGGMISSPLTVLETLLDYEGAISAATYDWETDTGFTPFLMGTADEVRYFDPTNSYQLNLCAGLLTLTSLEIDGTELTENEDFYLYPLQAPLERKPFSRVQFRVFQNGLPRTIVITGRWGYQETLTDDVKQAILRRSAYHLIGQIAGLRSNGGVDMWEEGDVKQSFGGGKVMQQIAMMYDANYRAVMTRYKAGITRLA